MCSRSPGLFDAPLGYASTIELHEAVDAMANHLMAGEYGHVIQLTHQ
ncbi:MAG: hypothetical protein ACRDU9_09795 [Acidimicrobiia bacterium]